MYYQYKTPFEVGVDTSQFNEIYAYQQNSMWCWAACLEMILRHNGVEVSQREFAANVCGTDWNGIPYNCPASFEVITDNLNLYWTERNIEYHIDAPLQIGYPNLFELYDQLYANNPVVVTYREPRATIGHAVLITGINGYFYADKIVVEQVYIRDPTKDRINALNNGIKVKHARNFFNMITAHWFVKVHALSTTRAFWF